MDMAGVNRLIISMMTQAAKEYRRAFRRGDKLTCNLINKQILSNPLVITAGFDDIWIKYTKSLL